MKVIRALIRSLTARTSLPALLLAAVLLAAQGWGLQHRLAHGAAAWRGLDASSAASGAHFSHTATAPAAAPTEPPSSSGHEPGDAQCQLLDQLLSHADVLLASRCGLGTAPAAAWLSAGLPASSSRLAFAAYQARAPPVA